MFIRQKLLKHECTENVADIVFFINRAAMGRARFLLYTGFISRRSSSSIFNRAAMGRARFLLYTGFLTARPWAERGSCFTRDLLLLLTARPWAERGSCFTWDLLFFFVFLSVTRPKPPLGQITIGTESRNLGCLFAKSCWNNDVREMLRIMFSLL